VAVTVHLHPQRIGYLCMSTEVLERTYGHRHPDYMRTAAQAITAKQSQNISSVIPLVCRKWTRPKGKNANDLMVGPGGREP
jgi:hypothetical protein